MNKEKNSEIGAGSEAGEGKKRRRTVNVKGSFQSRQFKAGAYSSLLTVLVIAIVVIINLVFSKLDLTTDLSKNGLFTLTKETKKVVNKMEQDVTLYYMVEDGKEEDYIYNVLKQYGKASDHISLKKVDPVVNPGFASNHGIDSEIADGDVIVENEKTKAAKYISYDDMYSSNQSYTAYGSEDSDTYLDAEGQITSAIQSVLSGQKNKMYIMTKHSELTFGSSLTDALEKMDIETAELELASRKAVPEDCDILLLNGPSTDLTKEEKKMVLDYLKAGGHAMINLAYTENELPNVEEILNYYGVRWTKGVIFEGAGYYASYPNAILPSVNSEYTPLSELKGYIIFPNAAGLAAEGGDALRSSVTITDIMDTSESSYIKTDMSAETIEKEDGDIDGPFSVGLSVTESLDGGKETSLIVYSSATAFIDEFTATTQLSNSDVFQKSISSLAASDTEKVSIAPKNMSYSYISVMPGTQLFWAAVLIVILPAGLLITGFGIWFVRRRK